MAWFFKGDCPSGNLSLNDRVFSVAKDGRISPDLSDSEAALVSRNPLFGYEDRGEKSVHIEQQAPDKKSKRRASKKSPKK